MSIRSKICTTYPYILMVFFFIIIVDASAAINDNTSSSDKCSFNSYDSPLTVIRAQEIIEKIKDGDAVDFDHVRVEGNLNLSTFDIKKSIIIRNSVISEFADFSYATFEDYVNFESTTFQDDATFRLANFKEVSTFTRTQFKKSAYFSEVQFNEEANFNMAEFVGPLYFYHSLFLGYSNFRESTFNDLAFFWLTQFLDGADFTKTTFNKKAYFESTIFSGYYKPMRLTYYDVERMDRGGPRILGDFQGCANFEEAIFNGLAYFSGAKFSGNISLKNAKIYSMDLESVVFEENSKLNLAGSSFVRLIVPWNQIKDHLVFDGSVYQALIRNYKDLQRFADADDSYYDYRAATNSGFLDTLALLSCGYGVRPIVTLIALGVLILIWGLLLDLVGYGLAGFYYSAATVLSISTEFRPAGYYRVLVIVEKFFGYLLLALFLVTLGNIMIR